MSSPRPHPRPRPRHDKYIAPPMPHDLIAEKALLGGVLLNNAYLAIASEKTKPDDFFLPEHHHIFQQMLDMAKRQVAIDTLTLRDELARIRDLEAAGGAAYLSALVDGVPCISNVAFYADIVRQKAILRRVIYASKSLQEQAFAGEDANTILDRAGKTISELRVKQSTNPSDLFDTWEEFKTAKPLRSLIENFLQADVCNVVGGLSGDGKTLILFSLTKALLTGKPLFGFFKVLEPLHHVVYLIPECARAPFLHRAKIFGLDKYLQNGRLLVRTLSKGPRIPLHDAHLLSFVKDACIMIDTAARFSEGDENAAGDVAGGLATDIFGLLAAGAAAVEIAHHAPKSFEKENRITLEGVLRGSGDFGAFVGAGFGIRQIDEVENVIHLEDVKPRDTQPAPPFQIVGRPFIDQEGDFRIYRRPGECAKLDAYLETHNKGGGASDQKRGAKAANLALMAVWLKENPDISSPELVSKFKAEGIDIKDSTVRNYKSQLEKRPL